ncbi:MAG: hypothetical protein HY043_04620 [Verrucomicrobia bacterium]|nr:hypothetical protein [Verrucomicrobiota bacterium]
MSLNQKLRLAVLLPAAALLVTGCGGFNTTQSVSPATFLLPGFMQIQPTKKSSDLWEEPAPTLAAQISPTQTQLP